MPTKTKAIKSKSKKVKKTSSRKKSQVGVYSASVKASPVKPRLNPPANLPIVTAVYPNTTPLATVGLWQSPASPSNSVIQTPRAAFYLGVTVGVLMMSLLVTIGYFAVVGDKIAGLV